MNRVDSIMSIHIQKSESDDDQSNQSIPDLVRESQMFWALVFVGCKGRNRKFSFQRQNRKIWGFPTSPQRPIFRNYTQAVKLPMPKIPTFQPVWRKIPSCQYDRYYERIPTYEKEGLKAPNSKVLFA